MNIENLEAFVFVNHFGSINRASKALFLSQPSVTSRIKSLERELDTELFQRTGRQLNLTNKGAEFLPFAQNIVDILKKGKAHLHAGGVGNELAIASTGLISYYLIPRVLPVVKEHFPELKIKIVTAPSDEVSRMVSNQEVDIGFASNVSDPNINMQRIAESPIRLIVPGDHEFVNGTADAERLAESTIVFFACGSLDWTMVHNLFLNLEMPPSIKYEVDSMESAKGIILNEAAIGFLPELSVRREIETGSLYALELPELSKVSLNTDMIYRNDTDLPYLEDLVEIFKNAADLKAVQKPYIEPLYK